MTSRPVCFTQYVCPAVPARRLSYPQLPSGLLPLSSSRVVVLNTTTLSYKLSHRHICTNTKGCRHCQRRGRASRAPQRTARPEADTPADILSCRAQEHQNLRYCAIQRVGRRVSSGRTCALAVSGDLALAEVRAAGSPVGRGQMFATSPIRTGASRGACSSTLHPTTSLFAELPHPPAAGISRERANGRPEMFPVQDLLTGLGPHFDAPSQPHSRLPRTPGCAPRSHRHTLHLPPSPRPHPAS